MLLHSSSSAMAELSKWIIGLESATSGWTTIGGSSVAAPWFCLWFLLPFDFEPDGIEDGYRRLDREAKRGKRALGWRRRRAGSAALYSSVSSWIHGEADVDTGDSVNILE